MISWSNPSDRPVKPQYKPNNRIITAGSSSKWQNIIKMYIVEDQDQQKQNDLMFGKQQQVEWRFKLKSLWLQVSFSIISATPQLLSLYE